MTIEIRAKGLALNDTIREHVERRMGFALARFSDQIQSIRVMVEDLNGPKGGVDKLCKVVATMSRGDQVTGEARADGVLAAIDRVADRVKRAMTRKLDRPRARRLRDAMSAAPPVDDELSGPALEAEA